MTRKPQSLSSRGLGKLGLYGSHNPNDQELSMKAIDYGLDFCRVKGKEMALEGPSSDLSKKEVEFIRGRFGAATALGTGSLFCSSLCAG